MFHLLLLYIKQVYQHDNFLISLQNWFPDIKLNANFLLPLVVKTAENLGPIFFAVMFMGPSTSNLYVTLVFGDFIFSSSCI